VDGLITAGIDIDLCKWKIGEYCFGTENPDEKFFNNPRRIWVTINLHNSVELQLNGSAISQLFFIPQWYIIN